MDSEFVERAIVGETVVFLLDITVSPTHPTFQIETGQVLNRQSGGSAYEPQRLVVDGRVLLAIYEMLEPRVKSLREKIKRNQRPVK